MRHLSFAHLLVGLLVVCFAAPVHASILGQYLTFDGTIDLIRDDSVGDFSGSLAAPAVGNVLQGVYSVNTINSVSVQGNQTTVWGIYSLVVTGLTNDVVTGAPVIQFGAIDPDLGTGNSIQELATSLGLTLPSTLRKGTMDDATLLIVTADEVIGDAPNFNTNFVTTLGGASFANTWSLEMVMGLAEATDYHEVRYIPEAVTYSLAYSVIRDVFGPGVEYLLATGTRQFSGLNLGVSDFVSVQNNIITIPPALGSPTGWDFSDKGDFSINAIPEPASMALWSVLVIGGGLMTYRRRRLA